MKHKELNPEGGLSLFPLFCTVLYVASSIYGNILSTKIVLLEPFMLEVDAGTIVYPLAFVARDMLHKNVGRRLALQVVVMNGFFIAAMSALFFIGGLMPPSPSWPHQAAYQAILTPVWRIVIASIIAELLANILNTSIFSAIIRTSIKRDMVASLISNSAAMLVDSIIFSLIAFYALLPLKVVISIITVNVIVKGLVAIIGTPLVRLSPLKVDKSAL